MVDDIVFYDGDVQNFLVEVANGTLNSPVDIVSEPGTNPGMLCLETPLIVDIPSPSIILLSDGRLARKISSKFYVRM